MPLSPVSKIHVFLKLTLGVLKHLELEVTPLLLSQRLLSRLPQELLYLGLARIWMVLRNLGDGNVDLNATTCVMKVQPVDAMKCYQLCFKLYVFMEYVYFILMYQSRTTSSLHNEPVLSYAYHLGEVHVAGWYSPRRNLITAWIHLTQQVWLHHQQSGFSGVGPIPCAPTAPAEVILQGRGNWTL